MDRSGSHDDSQRGPSTREHAQRGMADVEDPLQGLKDVVGDSTVAIALVGALTAFLTTQVPGSPLLGGALAGYLVRDDRLRGTAIGALVGLVALVPTVIGAMFFFGFGVLTGNTATSALMLVVLLVFFSILAFAYTVGLGAVGGYVGVVVYQRRLKRTTERARRPDPTLAADDSRPEPTSAGDAPAPESTSDGDGSAPGSTGDGDGSAPGSTSDGDGSAPDRED